MNRVKLGSITDSCLGKMLDAEKNKGDYQPYLANINVRWGDFDLENLPMMRFESTENDRYGILKGDYFFELITWKVLNRTPCEIFT